jgi:hypothetical protein
MNSGPDRFHFPGPGTLLKRVEFGSVVMIPYVLAIVWQYFFNFRNKPFGWALAVVATLIVWLVYLSLTEAPTEKLSWHFWLLVALPLLFFYLLRLSFPDVSFDVLNYHIFHSERALRGPLLTLQDFFPTPAPFNPTPDIVTGLYRYALGYRLGTVVNYLALIWTGTIISRILQSWLRPVWLRCVAVFLVLATEQLLFQINNYMVDLLALPLLLEATLIAIKESQPRNRIIPRTLQLALLLGAAAAFKWANLIYAVPIVLIYIFNVVAPDRTSIWRLVKVAPLASWCFVLPLWPFTILIYRLTGNPVFPLYNGLFKSSFWPQGALFDPRWGPYGIVETIAWPVVLWFRPQRLSEYAFYSGRLSIGFVVAALLVLFAWRNRAVWQVAFITLFASIVWSATSGYIRYALFLEVTSGILIVWLAAHLCNKLRNSKVWLLPLAALAVLISVQAPLAIARAYRWEWSARATIFDHRLRLNLDESRNLLRDRSLRAYLSPEDLKAFDPVDGWIETTYKTTAIQALLKPEVPAVGVRMGEFFLTPVARRRFREVIAANRGKRLFTLTDSENFDHARDALAARGLVMGEARPVTIYYFSRSVKFDLLLVEVMPKAADGNTTERGKPLPDDAFMAKLSVANGPATMRAGEKYELRVGLKNESDLTWPGRQPTWQFQLTIGNRWLNQSGEKVSDVDGRSALLEDLKPGATIELPLTVTAPSQPGIYILQLDAIQESVAWFGDRGSEILSLKIKVE